jgi:hypothetical protein
VSQSSEPLDVRSNAAVKSVPGTVVLELPAEGPYRAVGRLVAGGVASRLGFQVAQIEDLQLAVEAVLSHCPARATVALELLDSGPRLVARLGPFASDPAARDRAKAMLRALVEDVEVQDSPEGEWFVLSAAEYRATP